MDLQWLLITRKTKGFIMFVGNKENNKVKLWFKIILAMSILVFSFSLILIHAQYSLLTLDEAGTYTTYVRHFNWGNLNNYLANYDGRANNHLLNSVLIFILDKITDIPYNDFLIRLPNVLFGMMVGIVSAVLYVRGKISGLIFVLLNLNAFLSNAFSIARGYGIASALVFVAVVLVGAYVSSVEKNKYYLLTLAILFLTLAESANTVVLMTTFSIGCAVLYYLVRNKQFVAFLKSQIVFLILLAIPNFLLVKYHFYIVEDGEGKSLASFYGSALDGVIGDFIKSYTYSWVGGLQVIFLIVLLVVTIIGVIKNKPYIYTYSMTVFFCLCCMVDGIFHKGLPSKLTLIPTYALMVFVVGEWWEILRGLLMDVSSKVITNGKKSIVGMAAEDAAINEKHVAGDKAEALNVMSASTADDLERERSYGGLLWGAVQWIGNLVLVGMAVALACRTAEVSDFYNLTNQMKVMDVAMGGYEADIADEGEFHSLHLPYYRGKFQVNYGYDIVNQKYTIENMHLNDLLYMLKNEKFQAVIDITDAETALKYSYELKKLGVDLEQIRNGAQMIVINHDWLNELQFEEEMDEEEDNEELMDDDEDSHKVTIEYLYDIKGDANGQGEHNVQDTCLGQLALYMVDSGYGLYRDGTECLIVDDPSQVEMAVSVWYYGDLNRNEYNVYDKVIN